MRTKKGTHYRFRAERRRNIPRKGANIRTAATSNLNTVGVFLVVAFAQQFHAVDMHLFGCKLEFHARARKLVPSLSVYVLRAVLRRDLHNIPEKGGQNVANFTFSRYMPPINEGSRAIQGIRVYPKGKLCDILLFFLQKIIEKARGIPYPYG